MCGVMRLGEMVYIIFCGEPCPCRHIRIECMDSMDLCVCVHGCERYSSVHAPSIKKDATDRNRGGETHHGVVE